MTDAHPSRRVIRARLQPWARRLRTTAVACMAIGTGLVGWAATAPSGAVTATAGGSATPTDASASPLTGTQASSTPFSLTLSPTDACSGTTTTDGTHWFSYVEPQGGQPTIGGTIDFSAGFPSSGFGIYSSTNHYLTGN